MDKAKLIAHFANTNAQLNLPEINQNFSQASVLIPILDHANDLTVLFTERTSHLSHHAGQISFPGGRAEKNDHSLIETCLRETQEEIGISASQIHILGSLEPMLSSSGFLVTPFVGLIKPPFELEIDTFEVANTFTVPLAFLLDPANHTQEPYIHHGEAKSIYVIEYEKYRIWGLTARIIVDLAEDLSRDTDHG